MILALFNPNGGSGKTTTAVNLATELARRGRTVLLVDLEANMGASISVGVRPDDERPSVMDLLLNARRPSDSVQPVPRVPNLHLICGSAALAGVERALRNVRQPERRLADCIRPLAAAFDDVILDAPANFTVLSLSVPTVAHHLVVPIRCDYLALESLAHFFRWYRDRRAAGRERLAHVSGILLTTVNHKRSATREIIDIIRLHNRRGVFETEIPDDPHAAEAPSHGVPLVMYSRSRASLAYQRFTTELLRRVARRRR